MVPEVPSQVVGSFGVDTKFRSIVAGYKSGTVQRCLLDECINGACIYLQIL